MTKKLFLIPALLLLIGCAAKNPSEASSEDTSKEEQSSESIDDRETESITLTFTAEQAATKGHLKTDSSDKPVAYTWTDGNVSLKNDKGSQYSFTDPSGNFPTWRFYVGTFIFINITTGSIKDVVFTTEQYNPFQGGEVITNGKLSSYTSTSATIKANDDVKEVKIHNSDKGDIEHGKKQIRFTKVVVTWYK